MFASNVYLRCIYNLGWKMDKIKSVKYVEENPCKDSKNSEVHYGNKIFFCFENAQNQGKFSH